MVDASGVAFRVVARTLGVVWKFATGGGKKTLDILRECLTMVGVGLWRRRRFLSQELREVWMKRREGKTRRTQHGYALTELLVTVAIILVLAGILLPSFGRARALARLTACKAHLHAQTRAHALYGSANDDHKPPLWLKGPEVRIDWVSPGIKWENVAVGPGLLVVGEYLEFEALLCPSASMRRDAALDTAAWRDRIDSGTSYVYFWRHPDDVEHASRPQRGATYQRAIDLGRPALVMDVNCAAGQPYTGEYEDRAWESHPSVGEVNVAYATGVVVTEDSEDIRLELPGDSLEELAWFDKAHALR